jgi:hypothetical protein
MGKSVFTTPSSSPQVQLVRPPALTLPQPFEPRSDSKGTTAQVTTATESLEQAASNLSLHDGNRSPKQGKQRGRHRGRSNVSKGSSPQRTFHNRTSSGDQQRGSRPPQQNTAEAKVDPLRGVLPMGIPSQSPKLGHPVPLVRLPEVLHPAPGSEVSQDTSHLIRSSDTDFGSDISRGAVKGGRLYDHRQDKLSPKIRPVQKFDSRPPEENPQLTRGVLPNQPKAQEPTQSARRGGLLIIDSNTLKSNNTKPNKSKGQQGADYNRNATPLRKEDGRKKIWNRDDYDVPVMLHERPRVEVTPEYILKEVKAAYQEIQTLENKVKIAYEDDDIPRNTPWQSLEETKWPSLARMHKEYYPHLLI